MGHLQNGLKMQIVLIDLVDSSDILRSRWFFVSSDNSAKARIIYGGSLTRQYQLGFIRSMQNIRWQHLSQMKERLLKLASFFYIGNATNRYNCCHHKLMELK